MASAPLGPAGVPWRLTSFLIVTFAITWGAWWTLVRMVPASGLRFNDPPIMTLYLLGGFGPTIAAFIAVAMTRRAGSMGEYIGRLLRWKINPGWYVAALALPPVLAIAALKLTQGVFPGSAVQFEVQAAWRIVPLFATMIIGGGLEELGWRGVAQPALEQQTGRLRATAIIGVIWAAWHLPLFFIPGVSQYGTSFPLFALDTIGIAFVLAWLYGGTRSILLCVCCHAAFNTTSAMGLAPSSGDLQAAALTAALLKLALGVSLVLISNRRAA